MPKFATVVIPFAYNPRWGQIVISSLKKFRNERDFDIILLDNAPERSEARVISDTRLGEGIKIISPDKERMRWHGGSLDFIIPSIETPYMFSIESDCTVMRDGWLDWYASFLRDEYTGMVGWYWKDQRIKDDERHYINSSATLYNTKILKYLHKCCMENEDQIISYGLQYEKRKLSEHTAEMIKNKEIGPFSDSRGFFNMYPVSPKPDKWWHEPGCWIYYRMSCQWECIKVPGEIIYNTPGKQPDYTMNYYGNSLQEAYAAHYWGGTVSHNYEKHLISTPWEKMAQDYWLEREFRLWKEWVPEDIREYSIKEGLIKTEQEEIAFARSRLA